MFEYDMINKKICEEIKGKIIQGERNILEEDEKLFPFMNNKNF